jgi:uncharacterized caspase-like protein
MRALITCLLLALAPLAAAAEASRVALVIGNARYKDSPLLNPVNDARALSSALRSAGFEVIELHEQGSAAMRRAIREFGEKLRGKDAGLFYFAGHGVQVRGRNYLVPVDADIKYEDEIEDQSVEIGLVLAKMESAKARVNLVVLDACRNNPFARANRSAHNGLAPMEAPIGTLIAFATSPGQVASDGTAGNGLYTSHLVREMTAPGLKVEDVFKRVRAAVRLASNGRQIPWENTSLEGDFYFREAPRVDTAALERESARRQEEAIRQAVADALTRSRAEADREKQRLERFYAEKLEAEREAFRRDAAHRIAELEKAAVSAAKPQVVAIARPEPLPASQTPLAAPAPASAAPIPAARPPREDPRPAREDPRPAPQEAPAAAVARPAQVEPRPADPAPNLVSEPPESEARERTNEEMPAALLLALGVDPAARNRARALDEDVAQALRPASRVPGDTWTWYRTIRDGEGVERRNYYTATVAHADKDGFRVSEGDTDLPASYDAAGNLYSAKQGATMVVHDPLDEIYRFPLQAGATWTTRSRERRGTSVVDVDGRVTVMGREDVTTPAGRFSAFKVTKVSNRTSEPFPGQIVHSKRVVTVWYAPAIGNIARFEGLEVTDRGAVTFDQKWELDSFELK